MLFMLAALAGPKAVVVHARSAAARSPSWYLQNGYHAMNHVTGAQFRVNVDPRFIIDGDEFPPPKTLDSVTKELKKRHPLDAIP